jgi:Probable sensor domain DACNK/DisA bacterial checkpoint controller nucleotide-binding
MASARSIAPGRLRRLREELIEEVSGVVESVPDPDVLLEELDYALRPPRHERRVPTYGSIVLPTVPTDRWDQVTGLRTEFDPTSSRDDHDVRRYADGLVSWTVRDADGIGTLAVFDRAAGSERDLVVIGEATGGCVVQRRPDAGVRLVGSFGVARWDGSSWHVEPPFGSWFERASCGLSDEESSILDRLLRFAVHDLGALGIGALFVLGGRQDAGFERRMATPPPLRLDRPTDLGPLRHVLGQIDGAAFIDAAGVVSQLGVRLVPSVTAEETVSPIGGTRHTSARRYSADDPEAIVVVVSDDGPVTVFRAGQVIGRSPIDE